MRRKNKRTLLICCIVIAAATTIIALKASYGSRIFKRYVCNPIPKSVKNIKAHRPWEASGHTCAMHFNISKADLTLILNSRRFREMAYVEYEDGCL
ncbi:MAG: hypothetical protein ACYSYV_05895, partial [Planctomycetota bacterium]